MAGAPVFTVNTPGFQQLGEALNNANAKSLDEAYKVLRIATQEYKKRIQRVSPVEYGTMRQSWQAVTNRDEKSMSGEVGTSLRSKDGLPYPLYLELGTARIAGGQVMLWKEGDAPIMEWKAKLADIPNFYEKTSVGDEGSKKHERAIQTATKAFTAGLGEQMPFIRPIGYEMAPGIIKVLIKAIAEGAQAAMQGKKF